MSQEKTRYSDDELAEFRELIQEKLKEAHVDYTLLVGSLSHNDDHGTDDTGRT
ncbi:MAG: TraR/DksA family transcriptional regulator, partial [Crocinitomicaceae bacterium]